MKQLIIRFKWLGIITSIEDTESESPQQNYLNCENQRNPSTAFTRDIWCALSSVVVPLNHLSWNAEHVVRMCETIMNVMSNRRYDHPNILAGQGTIGIEILEQVPKVDAILVPVGGGGLIAGLAVAVKGIAPHVKVIVSPCVLPLLPTTIYTIGRSYVSEAFFYFLLNCLTSMTLALRSSFWLPSYHKTWQ